ncbi:MAG: EamA family transporter [Clostridiales bacterium]|nr:EamA family transporter [Candidatus Crickella equi]
MKSRWLLIPMVVAGGIGDMMSKFFEAYCNHAYESVFVCLTFLVAQIICIALCVFKGERINKYDVGCGVALGIANYLSTDLLIRSIYTVPAYMAYIIFGFGVILIVNFVNLAVMHEQLNRKDYLGMAMAVVAIILLNL